MGINYNSAAEYTLEMAIRLSIQRALLCQVTSNLRMVAIEWDEEDQKICLLFYFDKGISDEEQDIASSAAGEFWADFDETTEAIEKYILLAFPKPLPIHKCTVYRREE